MATRKKKKNETTAYVKAVLIFICAVGVSLVIFLLGVQNSIEKRSQKTIVTNVSRQSEHVKSILDIHYGYLNGIAKEIGKSDNLLSDANMEMLDALAEKTALERTALVEPDGTAHYDNGVTKNVSARRYFKEAIRGKETLSDPLESSVDQEVRVVLCVPVYKEDKVIGVLGGSCNVTALSHMLFDDLFGGAGNSLITTRDGEIIAFDGGSSSNTEITYGTNLFNYYGEKNPRRKHILQDVQAEVEVAADGAIAVAMLQKAPVGYYDVILMDIQMPKMNGYQATEAIRKLPDERAQVPIIAMTANAFEEDRQAAFAAGMDDYLAKPIEIDKLLRKIVKVLEKK